MSQSSGDVGLLTTERVLIEGHGDGTDKLVHLSPELLMKLEASASLTGLCLSLYFS